MNLDSLEKDLKAILGDDEAIETVELTECTFTEAGVEAEVETGTEAAEVEAPAEADVETAVEAEVEAPTEAEVADALETVIEAAVEVAADPARRRRQAALKFKTEKGMQS